MGTKRLKKDLVTLGTIGRRSGNRVENHENLDEENGITRYTGSEADKEARDFVVELMKDAGMEVKIDRVGNIFGIKEGTEPEMKSILVGSHIDTVTNGGMFDGALGVVAGIEAVRRLIEEDPENKRTIEVVVYTAEEGSSFPKGLLGSSYLIDNIYTEEALDLENEEGDKLGELLEDIGYKGDYEKSLKDVEYALELHVEQGPVLDKENIPIGIVENITGYTWLDVVIKGEENHAGTTPMNMRKDALVGASEIVLFVNEISKETAEKGSGFTVGTVGRLSVHPNGTNIVPGKVIMGIDIRDVIKENIDMIIDKLMKKSEALEKTYALNISIEKQFEYDPISLSDEVVYTLKDSAENLDLSHKLMNSGAGHDSQKIAEEVKTGMIFVPSVDGVSHSPMEWTEWNDVEKGVELLTETIKSLSE